jgi:regulator of cell morphogenesis and NO signaling
MFITPQATVGDIVTLHPATLKVFQRHGIDFCCGGHKPVADACEERRVPVAALLRELEDAARGPEPSGHDWSRAPLRDLITHVLDTYHTPLRQELPVLLQLAEKVALVHGAKHPAMLRPIQEVLQGFASELQQHMFKEEVVLFPGIIALEEAWESGEEAPVGTFPSLAGPLQQMEREHEQAGAGLATLRRLSGDYDLPSEACGSFGALFRGLAQLETTMHEHVHLENNILFPRAFRLEQELQARH